MSSTVNAGDSKAKAQSTSPASQPRHHRRPYDWSRDVVTTGRATSLRLVARLVPSEAADECVHGLVEGRASQAGAQIPEDAQRRDLETSGRSVETADRPPLSWLFQLTRKLNYQPLVLCPVCPVLVSEVYQLRGNSTTVELAIPADC